MLGKWNIQEQETIFSFAMDKVGFTYTNIIIFGRIWYESFKNVTIWGSGNI